MEAMDGEGTFEFIGEVELSLQALELVSEIVRFLPAVEATFADGGVGVFGEKVAEELKPVCGAFGDVPGVKPEGREDFGVLLGELFDVGPVGFGGAIDEHVGDAMVCGFGQCFGGVG